MTDATDDRDLRLDRAIGETLAEEPSPRPTSHPEPDVLLAYQQDDLPEAEAERVLAHLVDCEACSDVILDFAAFPDLEPPTEEHRATPAELQRDWRELQDRIVTGSAPWWRRHEYAAMPAKAFVLLLVLGLGAWAWQLRQGNEQLRESNADLRRAVAESEAPSGDVSLTTLASLSQISRGGVDPNVIPLEDGGRVILVLPSAGGPGGADRFTLDLLDSAGGELLRALPVTRSSGGAFVVALPTRLLEKRASKIEVYAEGPGGRELLDEYPLVYGPEGDPGRIDGSGLDPDRADP